MASEIPSRFFRKPGIELRWSDLLMSEIMLNLMPSVAIIFLSKKKKKSNSQKCENWISTCQNNEKKNR